MDTDTNGQVPIVAIQGSVRPGNYTAKALTLVVDELHHHAQVRAQVLDPTAMRLPFPGVDDPTSDADILRQAVSEATGVILATPEYHGGFSSVMKLVIENLGFPSVLAGKPVALLGVAAGQIGAIKSLESLRSVCSHIGAIVLPGPVSVAGVQALFDEAGQCLDPAVDQRIRSVATSLVDYIEASICPRLALEAMVRAEAG